MRKARSRAGRPLLALATLAALAALATLSGACAAHPHEGARSATTSAHRPSTTGPTALSTQGPHATPTPTPLPIDPNVLSQNVDVGIAGTARSYQLLLPPQPVADRLPVVVVLAGIDASISDEERRTGLLPQVESGNLILVYPVAYHESWNAGGCCGAAAAAGTDDVRFLDAVLAQVAARPDVVADHITLLGYSNGGRMAYAMACQEPAAMNALVVVDAVPTGPCPAGSALPLLQIDSIDDPDVSYNSADARHHVGGFTEPTVIGQVDAWLERNGCAADSVAHPQGFVDVRTYSDCTSGCPVWLASYRGIKHLWPSGDASTPSAAAVVWQFLGALGANEPGPSRPATSS